jgi:hypothetical protein
MSLSKNDIRLVSAYCGVTVAFTVARAKRETAPFVVALCDGAEAGVEIASSKLLFGQLPPHKLLLVQAWIEIHREEFVASWHAGRLTGDYMRLDPLR